MLLSLFAESGAKVERSDSAQRERYMGTDRGLRSEKEPPKSSICRKKF